MVIKAGMGSSPLAVVPYTFSLISQSISYGTMVIIYNNLMNVLQIIILKGKVKKIRNSGSDIKFLLFRLLS